MDDRTHGFATRALHAGTPPDPVERSRAMAIHATAAYAFRDAAHAAAVFAGDDDANQYGRMHNPTTDAFAERMRSLEGGVGAVALASGQAASAAVLLALARPGARVLLSREAFGGTFALFRRWLEPWGVRCTTVAPTAEAVGAAMGPDVAAVWVETIANPSLTVPDLPAVAAVAHAVGVPLVVDNTWGCGGYLCRPLAQGADLVVHSATKWIGGHGTFLGGVVIDGGGFACDATGGAVRPVESGAAAVTDVVPVWQRVGELGLFTIGATLSPYAAALALQGLETLEVRCARACASAAALAAWLAERVGPHAVGYPGLPGHASHAVARRVLQGGFGSVVTLDLAGRAEAFRFLDALRVFSLVANVGDAKSLAVHPVTTTHAGLTEAERAAAGVRGGTVRLSVGLESVDDLRADLAAALAAAA